MIGLKGCLRNTIRIMMGLLKGKNFLNFIGQLQLEEIKLLEIIYVIITFVLILLSLLMQKQKMSINLKRCQDIDYHLQKLETSIKLWLYCSSQMNLFQRKHGH